MVYAFCRWIIIYFPHSTFSHYRYSNGFRASVALIQAYVFSILSCIYLNDTLNMH